MNTSTQSYAVLEKGDAYLTWRGREEFLAACRESDDLLDGDLECLEKLSVRVADVLGDDSLIDDYELDPVSGVVTYDGDKEVRVTLLDTAWDQFWLNKEFADRMTAALADEPVAGRIGQKAGELLTGWSSIALEIAELEARITPVLRGLKNGVGHLMIARELGKFGVMPQHFDASNPRVSRADHEHALAVLPEARERVLWCASEWAL